LVPKGGLEPQKAKTEDANDEGRCKIEKAAPSPIPSLNSGKPNPELAKVVAGWEKLGPELRAAILAIIASAEGGQKT
jgi:hypothetical protein